MPGQTSLTDADLTGHGRPFGVRDPFRRRRTGAVGGAGGVGGWYREAIDRLLGSDPGLAQLRTAGQAVLGMAVAIAAAVVLVRLTGALQAPPASLPPAALRAQHQAVLVVGMLLSALPAMLAGFVVTDATARAQIVTSVLLPVPMLAALVGGLALAPWHVASLAYLVLVLMAGVYLRRFGPRGFAAGMVLFNGSFLGYFLGSSLHLREAGWIAAFVFTGIAASLVVRFALFRPHNAHTLMRMRRSWGARARRLTQLVLRLTDPDLTDQQRAALVVRVQRQLTRLNESSLMIDAQLVAPGATPIPGLLHQGLFDMETALANTARFTSALTVRDPRSLPLVRATLIALAAEDDERTLAELDRLDPPASDDAAADPADASAGAVLLDRFAQSVAGFVAARRRWWETAGPPGRARAAHAGSGAAGSDGANDIAFEPAVGLLAGWLPGSAPVSDRAGSAPGRYGRLDTAVLPGYVRASIQIGVAATLAILVGGLVSERRLYWALLATFLAFLATTNSGEQVRKALFRVAGTAIGIVVGALAVHVTGGHTAASLAIIAVALFLGIYLIRINYTFMVIGITVAMAQLYVKLDEFSWSLLVLRLEETAIGVAAAVVTVLVVVPLRPQRVLTAGVATYLESVSDLVGRALRTMQGEEATDPAAARAAVRDLDAAHFALVSAATSLRRAVFGRNSSQLAEILAVATSLRHYARTLALGARPLCDPTALPPLDAAATQLRADLDALLDRVQTGEHGTYVRSAAVFDLVARALPPDRSELALRDLVLIDGALARLAVALCMDVTDHDTAEPRNPAATDTHVVAVQDPRDTAVTSLQ